VILSDSVNFTTPLVTVRMITYNHGPYVAQAIDSALMQETNFPWELLIVDDCSTDNTRDICKDYARRHPDRIRLELNERNLGVMPNSMKATAMCRGKYVAWLEGDDFWLTVDKLQRQVEVMQANPDIYLSFHAHKEVDANGVDRPPRDTRVPATGILPRGAYFRRQCEPFQTASFVFKRDLTNNLPEWFSTLPFGDVSIFVLASMRGPLYSLPGSHSCYRLHERGVGGNCWTEQDWLAKTRKTIFWNDAFARLFELLVDETDDMEIANQCRAYALDYLQDVIWSCRLLGDRNGMRLAISKSLRLAPWSAAKKWRMWKDALIAFSPLPDLSRHRHLTKACHNKTQVEA